MVNSRWLFLVWIYDLFDCIMVLPACIHHFQRVLLSLQAQEVQVRPNAYGLPRQYHFSMSRNYLLC